MAYDEKAAARLRAALAPLLEADDQVVERKMFGGLALMVNGYMAAGLLGDELVLRLGPDEAAKALEHPGVRPMDFTGRPMRGLVYVAPGAYRGAALARWLRQALDQLRRSPPKKPRRRARPRPRPAAGRPTIRRR